MLDQRRSVSTRCFVSRCDSVRRSAPCCWSGNGYRRTGLQIGPICSAVLDAGVQWFAAHDQSGALPTDRQINQIADRSATIDDRPANAAAGRVVAGSHSVGLLGGVRGRLPRTAALAWPRGRVFSGPWRQPQRPADRVAAASANHCRPRRPAEPAARSFSRYTDQAVDPADVRGRKLKDSGRRCGAFLCLAAPVCWAADLVRWSAVDPDRAHTWPGELLCVPIRS